MESAVDGYFEEIDGSQFMEVIEHCRQKCIELKRDNVKI